MCGGVWLTECEIELGLDVWVRAESGVVCMIYKSSHLHTRLTGRQNPGK